MSPPTTTTTSWATRVTDPGSASTRPRGPNRPAERRRGRHGRLRLLDPRDHLHRRQPDRPRQPAGPALCGVSAARRTQRRRAGLLGRVQVRELVGINTFVVAAVPAYNFDASSPAQWLNRPWSDPGTNLTMVVEYADAGKARIRFRDATARLPSPRRSSPDRPARTCCARDAPPSRGPMRRPRPPPCPATNCAWTTTPWPRSRRTPPRPEDITVPDGAHALTIAAVDAAGSPGCRPARRSLWAPLADRGRTERTLRAGAQPRAAYPSRSRSPPPTGAPASARSRPPSMVIRWGGSRREAQHGTVLPSNRPATVKITARDCIGRVANLRPVTVGATLAGNSAGRFSRELVDGPVERLRGRSGEVHPHRWGEGDVDLHGFQGRLGRFTTRTGPPVYVNGDCCRES